MSWLVAVTFPGFLMMVTIGLQRLEGLLHGERPSAAEWVSCLERAARAAHQKAAQHTLGGFTGSAPTARFDPLLLIDEPGLPTRPNPLFQPSGITNPV